MNLMESILDNTYNRVHRQETTGNDVFTVVTKAFAHDYLEVGESIIEDYVEVFGESTRPFFDFLSDNDEMLAEFVLNYNGSLMEADDQSVYQHYLLTERNGSGAEMAADKYKEKMDATRGARMQDSFEKQKAAVAQAEANKATDIKAGKNFDSDTTTIGGSKISQDIKSNAGVGEYKSDLKGAPDWGKNKFGNSASKSGLAGELGSKHPELGHADSSSSAAGELGGGHPTLGHANDYTNRMDDMNKGAADHVASATGTAAGAGSGAASAAKSMVKAKVTRGFLGKLLDKIKHFGGGIKGYFASHPGALKALGVAGGVAAGALLIRKLMKNRKQQQGPARA